jgi:hypothetical protein
MIITMTTSAETRKHEREADSPHVRNWYAFIGLLALVGWVALFAVGMLVDSKPYRDAIAAGSVTLSNVANALFIYTPTNVAMLSVLAALIGGCSSRVQTLEGLKRRIDQARATGDTDRVERLELRRDYLHEQPMHSMLRGFVVYIASVSGMMLITSEPFATPSAEQFTRLAGLLSTLSFAIGYDPTRLEDLVNAIGGRAIGQKKPNKP